MISEIKRCLMEEAQAIINLVDNINEDDIIPFLDILSNCKGKRCFTGVGKSLMVARKIASSFSSIGYSSIEVDPLRLLHGDLGFLSKDDLLIAISNSGETDSLVSALQYVKSLGVEIVSITGNEASSIARMSSCHLTVSTHEAGAFGLVPSSSTTAVMALGDALLCGLIKRDRLGVSVFYRYHPEGELGHSEK